MLGHNFVNFENSSPVPALVGKAYGVVLDLGAGSGNQLHRLNADRLSRVFGIESKAVFTPALLAKIKENAFEDIYTPIICRAEDVEAELALQNVTAGAIDCILSIQLLCSVDDTKTVVQHLHRLLKPGGELIFWEHQENETDWITRFAQGAFSHSSRHQCH